MKIRTLREKLETDNPRSCLNGKMFFVKANAVDGHVVLVDAETERILWKTSPISAENIFKTDDGVKFITDHGTEYDFVNVSSLIPTRSQDGIDVAEDSVLPIALGVISKNHEYKPIYYGDGYDKYVYMFDREITIDEFIKFVENEFSRELRFIQEYPYQDYDKVDGSGNEWTFTHILCYTD